MASFRDTNIREYVYLCLFPAAYCVERVNPGIESEEVINLLAADENFHYSLVRGHLEMLHMKSTIKSLSIEVLGFQ